MIIGSIKVALSILFLCVSIGAFVSIFIFAIDVLRWHDPEKKTVITPSNSTDESDSESEVIEDAGNDNDREHHTSAVPFSWGQS